jgi:hypothetical protein
VRGESPYPAKGVAKGSVNGSDIFIPRGESRHADFVTVFPLHHSDFFRPSDFHPSRHGGIRVHPWLKNSCKARSRLEL